MTTGRINQVAIPFHITGRATGPRKTNQKLPPKTARRRRWRVRSDPQPRSPGHPIFPRDANSRSRPRFRARSPLSDPWWCNACSFRPRSFTPYLATRAYVPGDQPVPPFARLRSGRPLSYHQEDEFDSQPSTSPSPKIRHSPARAPSASSPARPKPQDHGPSPFPTSSHCGSGRMFSAARGDRGGMPESNRRHIAARLGRYDVHFYTGADGNSGRKRLAMKPPSVVAMFPKVAN